MLQPTSASLSCCKLVLAFYPNSGPRRSPTEGRELCSFPQPDTTGPPSLPLFRSPSLSPFLVMEICPDPSMGGWRTGEKRKVDGEKRKDSQGSGGRFQGENVERSCSRPSVEEDGGEGGVGTVCWGTGDTLVSPVCQHRGRGRGDRGRRAGGGPGWCWLSHSS